MGEPSSPRAAKRVLVFILGAVLVYVVLVGAVWVVPVGSGPMPGTIWIRGAGPVSVTDIDPAKDVRIGASDGPAFPEARAVSSWGGGWSPGNGEGISFKRPITEGQRLKLGLARWKILPRFRTYGAGYEVTGQEATHAGVVWREFRMFDAEFNSTQIGWWSW